VRNLRILYTNADGLLNKRQDLKLLINSQSEKPDVIAITELKQKKIFIRCILVSLILMVITLSHVVQNIVMEGVFLCMCHQTFRCLLCISHRHFKNHSLLC